MGLLDYIAGIFKRKEQVEDKRSSIECYSTEELRLELERRKIMEISGRIGIVCEGLREMGVGQFSIIPRAARGAGEERRRDGRYVTCFRPGY